MEKLRDIFDTISKSLSLPKMTALDWVEIIIIALLLYYISKWIKNTRAWVIVKGLIVILIFWAIALFLNFDVILWILSNTIGVGITAIIILFQPELRKALENLGQRNMVALGILSDTKVQKNSFSEETVKQLVKGAFELARTKTGALIVIEGSVSLKEYEDTGIRIDGIVTTGLLVNIFEKNTPLHDGAVIIRGNRITSATCYLPLSDNMKLSKDLGTRHRAGVGVSEVTDSLTIIVSEETGRVSLAKEGNLIYNVDGDFLRARLMELVPETESESKNIFGKIGDRIRQEKAEKS